jgi:hypothetical protein
MLRPTGLSCVHPTLPGADRRSLTGLRPAVADGWRLPWRFGVAGTCQVVTILSSKVAVTACVPPDGAPAQGPVTAAGRATSLARPTLVAFGAPVAGGTGPSWAASVGRGGRVGPGAARTDVSTTTYAGPCRHERPTRSRNAAPSPEPGQVGLVTPSGFLFMVEDVIGLGQDQCVRASTTPGLVAYG